MRMNKHAKILDLVVLVVVVLFVWMNPFDIHLIKVVSAFRPKKPPANLPPGFFGTTVVQLVQEVKDSRFYFLGEIFEIILLLREQCAAAYPTRKVLLVVK